VLKAYTASLLGPDHPESGAPEVGDDAEGVYRRIAELDPSDPEPHWYLGLAALRTATARAPPTTGATS
jgi:hypothetical protein